MGSVENGLGIENSLRLYQQGGRPTPAWHLRLVLTFSLLNLLPFHAFYHLVRAPLASLNSVLTAGMLACS